MTKCQVSALLSDSPLCSNMDSISHLSTAVYVKPTYESNLSQFKALNVAPEDCFDPEDSHLISKLEKIINDERDDLLRYRQELKVFKLLKSMYWSRCFERDDDAILPILTQYYNVVSNTWKKIELFARHQVEGWESLGMSERWMLYSHVDGKLHILKPNLEPCACS